mmetsp:Transcript_68594/g.151900  ORF Transcript_68594/g.151900 Transcript_68594/m.151900 type:complete len:263 (-) Transcript_68594:105-893(-)
MLGSAHEVHDLQVGVVEALGSLGRIVRRLTAALQEASSAVVLQAAGDHGVLIEFLVALYRIQALLLVSAATHILEADAPVLKTPILDTRSNGVSLKSVLKEILREGRVFRKEETPIDTALAILQPVLVSEKEILARNLQRRGHLPHGIAFRPHHTSIGVEHHDVRKKPLCAGEVFSYLQMLLPINVLALPHVLALDSNLPLLLAKLALPRHQLRLRFPPPDRKGMAMLSDLSPVSRQTSPQPWRSPGLATPLPIGIRENRPQ